MIPDKEECFPGVQLLFYQAFAAVDPAPPMLEILKQHPTSPTIRDMLLYYVDVVEENPACAERITSALARIGRHPDAPLIGRDTLWIAIYDQLEDMHFKRDRGAEEVQEYGPKNSYLIDCLLSGLSFKYDFTSTYDQTSAIQDGLNAKCGLENSMILVVGTCVQLLLCGQSIVDERAGRYRETPEKVTAKLRAQRTAGTVIDPKAIRVLDLAIKHAETGFQPENDRNDVWALLFS